MLTKIWNFIKKYWMIISSAIVGIILYILRSDDERRAYKKIKEAKENIKIIDKKYNENEDKIVKQEKEFQKVADTTKAKTEEIHKQIETVDKHIEELKKELNKNDVKNKPIDSIIEELNKRL